MAFQSTFKLLRVVLIILIVSSCKPVIHSFNVTPAVITGGENVHIDWDVEGKPSLEFNEHLSVDSIPLLEYTLIVSRGGKEVRQTIQVKKMRTEATIDISFSTSRLEGDMVVASGENNNNEWKNFEVLSVSSGSSRDLIVIHDGRTATIKADRSPSSAFSGTSAGGDWSFKTLLTATEQRDSTKIPQVLQIKAVIKRLNQ